jgi:hypothetical protein
MNRNGADSTVFDENVVRAMHTIQNPAMLAQVFGNFLASHAIPSVIYADT